MDCEEIGRVSMILGGGREKKEDEIDLSVGIVLKKKCGDFIKMGEPLALLHVNDLGKLEEARERFLRACHFSKEAPYQDLWSTKFSSSASKKDRHDDLPSYIYINQ